MSKAVTKGKHWLPRHSQYSLHGHRTGRVDVLPPGAKTPLYDISVQIDDAAQRLDSLRTQKDALNAQLHSLSRFDQLRDKVGSRGSEADRVSRLEREVARVEAEMRSVRRRSGELKAIVAGGNNVTFEAVFIRIARAELPDDIFDALSLKAKAIVARASGRKP